jgi:AcrR family transcriptional regulator
MLGAMPRTRNPKGAGQRLRGELLAAAVALLGEHRSIEAVTLRAVAAAAGVSPTAVYRHFADRDELLRQAIAWCWDRFDRALSVPDTGDPEADFGAQGQAYLAFAATEPGIYRVLFSHRAPAVADDHQPGAPVLAKLVDRVGALLARRGDARDPRFVAFQVWTWIHGIADLQGSHPAVGPMAPALLRQLALALDLAGPVSRRR